MATEHKTGRTPYDLAVGDTRRICMLNFDNPAHLAKHYAAAKQCFLAVLNLNQPPSPEELQAARTEAAQEQSANRKKGMPAIFAKRARVRVVGPPRAPKWRGPAPDLPDLTPVDQPAHPVAWVPPDLVIPLRPVHERRGTLIVSLEEECHCDVMCKWRERIAETPFCVPLATVHIGTNHWREQLASLATSCAGGAVAGILCLSSLCSLWPAHKSGSECHSRSAAYPWGLPSMGPTAARGVRQDNLALLMFGGLLRSFWSPPWRSWTVCGWAMEE